MEKLIPNTDQEKLILNAYKSQVPGHKQNGVTILNGGLVVIRRKSSGSKIIGQVIRIHGFLIAYRMNINDHTVVYQGDVQPPKSEVEALKDKIAELENLLKEIS